MTASTRSKSTAISPPARCRKVVKVGEAIATRCINENGIHFDDGSPLPALYVTEQSHNQQATTKKGETVSKPTCHRCTAKNQQCSSQARCLGIPPFLIARKSIALIKPTDHYGCYAHQPHRRFDKRAQVVIERIHLSSEEK